MCIAILNSGNRITKQSFRNSLTANPDGFGLAYIVDNQIKTFHSLSDNFNDLWSIYCKAYKETDSAILIHFRITTHGGTSLENCHPFLINDHSVFIHNGMINTHGYDNVSDTRHFNEAILSKLTYDQLNDINIQNMIGDYIGYSKFVILDRLGDYSIINEELGHWGACGNWYSNESYKTKTYTTYKPYKKYDYWGISSRQIKECQWCGVDQTDSDINYNQEFASDLCEFCSRSVMNHLNY